MQALKNRSRYLIRKFGGKVRAHLWNGSDTECRLFSTGGMRKSNFVVTDETIGKEICLLCLNCAAKRS